MNLKERNMLQQQTWSAGDFPKMGVELAIVGEMLCESVPVYAGDKLLDVATASGNTALAAARRRAIVTGVDITPSLLDRARQRAAAEGLTISFQEGDATALAFGESVFDVVMSTFGAIFAPDPKKTAAEMCRVCRPGGKIAMANWTPEGLLGKLFHLLSKYSPPDARVEEPISWGMEDILEQRFGPYVMDMHFKRQAMRFRSLSPEHWVDFMRTYFGPAIGAFQYSSREKREELASEMNGLIREHNRAANGTILADSEYLEVLAVRK